MTGLNRVIIVCGVFAVLFGCTRTPPEAPSPFERALAEFKEDRAACTEIWGYAPDDGNSLGPYELGKNEKPWRACVYDAVERHLIPVSAVPDKYIRLMEQDRAWTARIEAREATRAEREAWLSPRISELREAETAALKEQGRAQQLQYQRDMQLIRQVTGSMRHSLL